MPVIKRYFHCSQDLLADPEVWEMIKEFGDRFILTWLQILIYLERTDNHWRLSGDWLAVLSRSVRQSSANLSRQVGQLVAKGWLVVGETSADGSPLVLKARNWSKYNNRREHKNETHAPLPSLPIPSVPSPSFPNTKIKKEEEKKEKEKKEKSCDVPSAIASVTPGMRVWERYKSAYLDRYQTEPMRNAKTNGQISKLIQRVGEDVAPDLASFYVWHNWPYYVRSRHTIGPLLQDCEGLYTQWKTGVKATTNEAKNLENRDNLIGQYQRVASKLEGV